MSGAYRMARAVLLLATGFAAGSVPAFAGQGTASLPAAIASTPPAKALPDVIVNDVLFNAVEYGTTPLPWRNLAITIKADRLAAWIALPQDVKDHYAQTMIDTYRAGLHYAGNVKLSFVDEQQGVVTQYVWTPPVPAKAAPTRH
jgi:hypothetical protein